MKYVLLLDSSNTSLTVGIADKEHLIDSNSFECWQSQSEYMVPTINDLLVKNNIPFSEITSVVVSVGPGSYTGVRIALTIAKTMAVALNADLFPVSSLRIQKCGNSPSICLINARNNRSYFGVYQGNEIIEKDMIMTNDEVLRYIAEHPDYTVCGKTSYLGIEGYISNYALEMFSLLNVLDKCEEPLGLKPVYMKD